MEALLGLLDGAGIQVLRRWRAGGQSLRGAAGEPRLGSRGCHRSAPVVERLLAERFSVRRFSHSINITPEESDMRVQIQTDPRYGDFADRAESGMKLGIEAPVAAMRDVLRGKVWAARRVPRRPSKRQKDLVDIARLIEAGPNLRVDIPSEILRRIEE